MPYVTNVHRNLGSNSYYTVCSHTASRKVTVQLSDRHCPTDRQVRHCPTRRQAQPDSHRKDGRQDPGVRLGGRREEGNGRKGWGVLLTLTPIFKVEYF